MASRLSGAIRASEHHALPQESHRLDGLPFKPFEFVQRAYFVISHGFVASRLSTRIVHPDRLQTEASRRRTILIERIAHHHSVTRHNSELVQRLFENPDIRLEKSKPRRIRNRPEQFSDSS